MGTPATPVSYPTLLSTQYTKVDNFRKYSLIFLKNINVFKHLKLENALAILVSWMEIEAKNLR